MAGALPAGVAVLALATWLAQKLALRAEVRGPSMMPSLRDGDRVLVNRLVYRLRRPRAGEVVLADLAEVPGGWVIKRVGHVTAASGEQPHGVPAAQRARAGLGSYFLVGDNPVVSTDSRQLGAVPRGKIRGRVWYRYWPPDDRGRVS